MSNMDDLFNNILENGPSSETLMLILSKLMKQGQYRRVIQECYKALRVFPEHIHIRQILAEAYLGAGQIQQSAEELNRITSKIDALTTSYKLLGEIYEKQGRKQDAANILRIYLAHHPEDNEASLVLESLQPTIKSTETGQRPEPEPIPVPEQEIPEASFTEPEDETPEIATPTLAELYFDQGHLQEAIDTYRKIIEKDPDDDKSKQRLQKLMVMMDEDKKPETPQVDKVKEKKMKMISTLESWLAGIQERSKSEVSPL